MKSRQIVIYDACVLYPAPLRSFLMYLALTDLFSARWTDDIHEEWMRAVEKDYPDITRAQLERVRMLMDSHVRDCLVTGYESLIPTLTLPDLDDRHVLAAAIHCGAQRIVTANLADFPAAELARHGIEALHPDAFVRELIDEDSEAVCSAARLHRAGLKNPPLTIDAFLAALERNGLPNAAKALRQRADQI